MLKYRYAASFEGFQNWRSSHKWFCEPDAENNCINNIRHTVEYKTKKSSNIVL